MKKRKNILKTKFGGERWQLCAYMDQLESIPQIKPRNINEFERFADLVRVTVVKLKAENHQGELGNGSLHSLLVKKLLALVIGRRRKQRSMLKLWRGVMGSEMM